MSQDYTTTDKLRFLALALDHGDVHAAKEAGVATRTLRRWRAAMGHLLSAPSSSRARPASGPQAPSSSQRTPEDIARAVTMAVGVPAVSSEDTRGQPRGQAADIVGLPSLDLDQMPEELACLEHKELLFVLSYCIDRPGNKSRSAEAAGYRGEVDTLYAAARRLLQKDRVIKAVNFLMSRRLMGAAELKARVAMRASADVSEFITVENGRPQVDLDGIKRAGLGFLIKSVKLLKGGHLVFEFTDPQKAEDMLAKMGGLYTERHELTVSMGLEDMATIAAQADRELEQELEIIEAELVEEIQPPPGLGPGEGV